ARARLLRRAPHSLTAEFALYDAAGTQIAAVQDARFRSIRLARSHGEALDFLDELGVPSPHPQDPRSALSTLDAAAATDVLASAVALATRQGTHACYAQEIEPLLDSLCDRYAIRALRGLAQDGPLLYDDAVERCRQTAPDTSPL